MAGHFPFLGKGGRIDTAAFFESHGLGLELQERYYRWWYDWTKRFVESDPDLSFTKAVEFQEFPYGQHALHSFHLNDKMWAVAMADLGDFLREVVLPRLDGTAVRRLEQAHQKLIEELEQAAQAMPRPPAPEVGYFRHT
jgi:hypothetical protein